MTFKESIKEKIQRTERLREEYISLFGRERDFILNIEHKLDDLYKRFTKLRKEEKANE